MSTKRHRLPFAPLERLVILARDGERLTDDRLAELFGMNRRNLYRWREAGIPRVMADRLAPRVGFHPLEVWGEEWDAVWVRPPRAGARAR